MAASRRVLSILTTASGWRSRTCSPRSRADHAIARRVRISVRVARPIRGPQQLENGGGDGGALAAGNPIQIDRATQLDALDRRAGERLRRGKASWHDRDAEARFQQTDEVALRRHFMTAVEIDLMAAKDRHELIALLAIGTTQQPLVAQVIDFGFTRGQPML